MKSYPPIQFVLFRFLLGIYSLYFFLSLLNYTPILLASDGLYPLSTASPFPNILIYYSRPPGPKLILFFFGLSAVLFAFGIFRRFNALILWYGWACLQNRLPFLSIPSEGYIGWLFLACTIIPKGEPIFKNKRSPQWKMPKEIFYGAWIVVAVSYSASGINKLFSPSWTEGQALEITYSSAIALQNFFTNWMKGNPKLMMVGTYLTLGLETLFAPLSLLSKLRPLMWGGMLGVHVLALLTLAIPEVSLGMILTHLFIMDVRWFKTSEV